MNLGETQTLSYNNSQVKKVVNRCGMKLSIGFNNTGVTRNLRKSNFSEGMEINLEANVI